MKYLGAILILSIISCNMPQQSENKDDIIELSFDSQGHRGARGLFPENSIEGFLGALKYGVKTLELDVVISKDSQIVVSHEPFMSHSICLTADGKEISEGEEMTHNIYAMTYEEVSNYDCGSKGNSRFPEQQKMATFKPTLRMVADAVATYLAENDLEPVYFNIETKSQPEGDNLYHPDPTTFAKLVYEEVQNLGIADYTTIQSFDPRTLEAIRAMDDSISTALLIWHDDPADHDLSKNLATLSFTPNIYSCYYEYLTQEVVEELHSKNILVIPWTVNEKEDMENLLLMGVDGIITDYPNRLAEVLKE